MTFLLEQLTSCASGNFWRGDDDLLVEKLAPCGSILRMIKLCLAYI
jgi:hypothetical protein